ncbi:XkdX family protein [Heyndrickxia oleronia]|nr:XkdX family protein [Heyndrickxia oleronia]
MMDYYGIVQRYYPKYYSKDDVKIFVAAEKITEEQYKEVTGEEYQAPTK